MSRKKVFEQISEAVWYLSELGTIVLPVVLFFYLNNNAGSLYIKELNLYIPRFPMQIIIVIVFFASVWLPKDLWFERFPLNVLCSLGPMGFLCFWFLLQGNFKLGAVIFVLFLLLLTGLFFLITRVNWKPEEKTRVFRRTAILFFLVLQIPVLCLVGFRYGFRNTHPGSGRIVISDDFKGLAALFETQKDKLECFKEENWRKQSTDGKREALQALADVYCEYLSAEPVKVSFKELKEELWGTYAPKTGAIHINKNLIEGPAFDAAETLCHEVRHAYQHDVIRMLDWNDDMVKNHYFYREARIWKAENADYVDSETGEYRDYYYQHTESDAREFETIGVSYLSAFLDIEEDYTAFLEAK